MMDGSSAVLFISSIVALNFSGLSSFNLYNWDSLLLPQPLMERSWIFEKLFWLKSERISVEVG